MARYEHIRISISLLQDAIMKKYNLEVMEQNGYMYCEIQLGMYGLIFVSGGKLWIALHGSTTRQTHMWYN